MGRCVSTSTRDLVARAAELWETVYQPAGIVPTVRQLFYALAVEERVPKSEKGYARVQRVLAAARERGDYPWEGIYDALRQIQRPNTWTDLDDYLDTVRRAYHLDKWQFQARRVEVWIEKDAVRGTVESVTGDEDVPLLIGRGYLSLTAKHEASLRMGDGGLTVLYIGDFDPSGVDMAEEAEAWIRDVAGGQGDLLFERVAITVANHADLALPHLPVNRNDRRAAELCRRYGDTVVEVEALPPETLQGRLREAILRHRDAATWSWSLAEEREGQNRLAGLLDGGCRD